MIFSSIFGDIQPPAPLQTGYGDVTGAGGTGGGLVGFFNNLLKLIILIAGLYALINFILAGYGIMSAGGDPEKVSKAQSQIWYAILGLVIIVISFTLAALVGWLVFHDTGAILNLKIYGPGP
jgi:hypothetical protein